MGRWQQSVIIYITMTSPLKQAQTTIEFMLGPVKIKDGLFLGDHFAAKDIQFIISNKVTHVINSVVKTVPNLYEKFGIQYLSVHWTEREENIFDKKGNALEAIFSFIEETVESGESCLIHSNFGKSRGFAVLAAYLMRKYAWSLEKCLEYARTKKEGLEIRPNYMEQLRELEARIREKGKLSVKWNQFRNEEDRLLANTLINSRKAELVTNRPKGPGKKRVGWGEKLVNKAQVTHGAPSKHKDKVRLKSILKGEPGEEMESEVEEQTNLSKRDITPQNRITNNLQAVVNNFMQTEKKGVEATGKLNARPYSSDAKERHTYKGPVSSKPHTFASSLSSSNPYEAKMGSRAGSAKSRKVQPRSNGQPISVVSRQGGHQYQRPISAKIAERRSAKPVVAHPNPLAQKLLPDSYLQTGIKMRRMGGGRVGRDDNRR